MNAKVDVLAVWGAECAYLNRLRRELGNAISEAEDKGEYVNQVPNETTLSDLNHSILRLREARNAVAELIAADREYDRVVLASRSGTPGEQYKAGAQLKHVAERRAAALAAFEGVA